MAKDILAVDDEPDVLKIILLRLEKIGYRVTGAIDGREALDLLAPTSSAVRDE